MNYELFRLLKLHYYELSCVVYMNIELFEL